MVMYTVDDCSLGRYDVANGSLTFGLGVCGILKYGSESEFQKPNRTVPNYFSISEKVGIPIFSEFQQFCETQ